MLEGICLDKNTKGKNVWCCIPLSLAVAKRSVTKKNQCLDVLKVINSWGDSAKEVNDGWVQAKPLLDSTHYAEYMMGWLSDKARPDRKTPDNTRKNPAILLSRDFSVSGGSVEIRTLEPFRVAGFQDRCLQPLGHTSVMRRTINSYLRRVKSGAVHLLQNSQNAVNRLNQQQIDHFSARNLPAGR